ncbi:hypothetical protein BC943DRAFT_284343 [Umbelopsis sp. AD052]|nr:hypothetical protein BC943DRAFT_284343 [Umbelopsis sp. AD052]
MSINWTMIAPDGRTPVPLPREKIFFKQSSTNFELDCSGSGYPGTSGGAWHDANGTVFLSNQRVIYLPDRPSQQLKSFHVPLLSLKSCKYEQPWFAANYISGHVLPVAGGGLSQPGQLKLIFKEGGGFEFYSIFRELLERIDETNEVPQHLEALPTYTASGSVAPGEMPPAYTEP